jgi:ATP-dependent helicase/DNAse subunit B
VPRPQRDQPARDVVRVTAFRDYLASPYRFYLRHVLKLAELDDRVDELSPQAFGTLLHSVLNEFARSDVRDSGDAGRIREFLKSDLQRVADEQFGVRRMMAVDVQLAQVEMRLAAFAEWQAERRRLGWRIVHSEQSTDGNGVPFDLGDGRSVRLHGRIDRIDRHDTGARWAIFDYKTGEAGRSPDRQHRREGRWVDLQLPLYRHIARAWGVEGNVELGYIILPSDTNQTQAEMAPWTDEDLRSADETAREVGRRILDGDFWQELDQPAGTLQEFDPVCQEGVLGREVVV